MLINDERSRNVYENKQKDDNFTEKKGDISTQRNDILYRSTRILLKPSVFLSLFERWGTNPSLQNVETRGSSASTSGRVGWSRLFKKSHRAGLLWVFMAEPLLARECRIYVCGLAQ